MDEQDELNTCKLENQDATKITSALADSGIHFSWTMMPPVRENIVFLLDFDDQFSISLFSSSFVTISSSAANDVCRVNIITLSPEQLLENFFL